MNRPSEKTLRLGEELFDYVPYGLTRFNAVQDLAEMADEANQDLREAVRAVLRDAQCNGGVPAAVDVAHLQRVFAEHEPISWSSEAQGELAGISRPGSVRSPNTQPSAWGVPLSRRLPPASEAETANLRSSPLMRNHADSQCAQYQFSICLIQFPF